MIQFCPRKECFIFSAETQKWKEVEEPAPVGLAFRQLSPPSSKALRYLSHSWESTGGWDNAGSGMASHGNCIYVVGGRENLYTGDGTEVMMWSWLLYCLILKYFLTRETGNIPWPLWSTASPGEPYNWGDSGVVKERSLVCWVTWSGLDMTGTGSNDPNIKNYFTR